MTYQGLNWQIKRSRFKDYKEKVSSIRPFQKCHTLQFNDNRTVTKLLYKMILQTAIIKAWCVCLRELRNSGISGNAKPPKTLVTEKHGVYKFLLKKTWIWWNWMFINYSFFRMTHYCVWKQEAKTHFLNCYDKWENDLLNYLLEMIW